MIWDDLLPALSLFGVLGVAAGLLIGLVVWKGP